MIGLDVEDDGRVGRPFEAVVARVPDEVDSNGTGSLVCKLPGLPVHERMPRCRGRADCQGACRHDRHGRHRERRSAPRGKAGEHEKRDTEDRYSHRHSVRRPEERGRPACAHEDGARRGDRLALRREQRGHEREAEDRGKDELGHRHVHAGVEGKVRVVEVREAVAELRPDGREPSRGAPGLQVDAERDPGGHNRRDQAAEQAKGAPLRCSRGEGERNEHDRAPERRERLLEAQPRRRDDDERRSHDADRPDRATHARVPRRPLLRGRPRGRPPAVRPLSARRPPAGGAAQAPAGEGVRRSSPPRRGRAPRRGG